MSVLSGQNRTKPDTERDLRVEMVHLARTAPHQGPVETPPALPRGPWSGSFMNTPLRGVHGRTPSVFMKPKVKVPDRVEMLGFKLPIVRRRPSGRRLSFGEPPRSQPGRG